jgi:hypothetical protein
MAFNDDIAWFEANRYFVAQSYRGQYVLVKDQTVHGAYPTYADAYNAGVARFGTERFLVEHATEEPPTAMV